MKVAYVFSTNLAHRILSASAYEREIDKNLIAGAGIGCFPDLYGAIGKVGGVDQVITL